MNYVIGFGVNNAAVSYLLYLFNRGESLVQILPERFLSISFFKPYIVQKPACAKKQIPILPYPEPTNPQ